MIFLKNHVTQFTGNYFDKAGVFFILNSNECRYKDISGGMLKYTTNGIS